MPRPAESFRGGTLTGIRPTKIALTKLYDGWTDEQIETYMRETYFTSKEKIDLSIDVAVRETPAVHDRL